MTTSSKDSVLRSLALRPWRIFQRQVAVPDGMRQRTESLAQVFTFFVSVTVEGMSWYFPSLRSLEHLLSQHVETSKVVFMMF